MIFLGQAVCCVLTKAYAAKKFVSDPVLLLVLILSSAICNRLKRYMSSAYLWNRGKGQGVRGKVQGERGKQQGTRSNHYSFPSYQTELSTVI